jgi:DinB superfamily
MRATDAVKSALNSTQHMLEWFVSDLSDADLLVRPVPGANHIAWQIGHLIVAEPFLVHTELPDAAYPELPAGFAEQYTKETSTVDTPTAFRTRAEYVDLSKKVRAATLALVDKLSDADLDRASTGRMAKFAPTLANLLQLVANHTMMHAGQFTVVRRKLGKPVLF